jgi:microcin C transport system permease protein
MLRPVRPFRPGQELLHHKDVWSLVKEKLPVSISLGCGRSFLSYLISVPLGIAKAVRAGSRFDALTSLLVLVGYAIPGLRAGRGAAGDVRRAAAVVPLRGLTSSNWESSAGAQGGGLPLAHHAAGHGQRAGQLRRDHHADQERLPGRDPQAVCADGARQGPPSASVLWKHVFRNALIPLVTGFPAAFIGAFFTGSLLIETLFSLDGLGLLSYESVMRRDYPVVLGTLYLFTLIGWSPS